MNKPILIISDQEPDHTRFAHLLAPKGYSVKGAFSGNAGTLLDQTDSHAAILMDYYPVPKVLPCILAI